MKTFNKVVKTLFYVSKRAISWGSFFYGLFLSNFCLLSEIVSFFWQEFSVEFWKFYPTCSQEKTEKFFLRWSFFLTFWHFEQVFCLLAKTICGGCQKCLMLLQKINLWDISFFEIFLLCSCFQTRRKKNSDSVTFVWKNFQNCFLRVQRKNRATEVFRNKIGFWAKTIQLFIGKISKVC